MSDKEVTRGGSKEGAMKTYTYLEGASLKSLEAAGSETKTGVEMGATKGIGSETIVLGVRATLADCKAALHS